METFSVRNLAGDGNFLFCMLHWGKKLCSNFVVTEMDSVHMRHSTEQITVWDHGPNFSVWRPCRNRSLYSVVHIR